MTIEKNKQKFFFKTQGQGIIYLIVAAVVVGSIFLVGGVYTRKITPNSTEPAGIPVDTGNSGDNKELQIRTLKFISPTPTPIPPTLPPTAPSPTNPPGPTPPTTPTPPPGDGIPTPTPIPPTPTPIPPPDPQ